MKIIFMGTPEFAVPSLKILIENNYNIISVVTTPDKPAGRGLKINCSPIKKFALENNLPILQPDTLNSEDFYETLKKLSPDLQVVVAFKKLPEKIWNLPPKGTINLHASILPNYRGAAPINHAIINGEIFTGVTTFFINNEIDAGDIIFSEKIPIEEYDTAGTLHDKLMILGAKLILKTVKAIENGNVKTYKQLVENNKIKLAPKINKEFCKINWNNTANNICNFIRGLSPTPGAWSKLIYPDNSEKIIKFLFARKTTNPSFSAGNIITDNKNFLEIETNDYNISIEELQIEGKRQMNIKEFLRGHPMDDKKII